MNKIYATCGKRMLDTALAGLIGLLILAASNACLPVSVSCTAASNASTMAAGRDETSEVASDDLLRERPNSM